ncbi:long-chain-alcohol O-fatty-acyltransferase-like [Silene latifolia]|uniref:long-chain-alcohol O-fatty-acyltransferase-like n=1 Tax=Silene latifolia TaxID=37657 RepID=UPI003D778918
MGNEAIKSLIKVWSIIFASLCYCYFISSKLPKGKLRLLSLIPIICLYILLPLSIYPVLPTGITSFFITWLASSKLLLFAFDLGPLTVPKGTEKGTKEGSDVHNLENDREPIKSLFRFMFIAAFPVKGNDQTTLAKKPTKVIPLNFWSKTLISSILITICDRYKIQLHPGVTFVIYCVLLYLLVDLVIDIANKLVGPLLHVELVPPSDEPYMSTSLQDFWGRRWNLMVTDTLRHTVYKPVRVFSSKYVGKDLALGLAQATSFLVSGLVHELIFYYMTRVRPSWEVTWFFVLHGVCVVVEVVVKNGLGRKVRLGRVVTGPLTIGFVMATAYLWFFPPLTRNQVDIRTIEEFKTFYGFVKGIFISDL